MVAENDARPVWADSSYGHSTTARRSLGTGVVDHGAPQIDMVALRGYRLRRLQAEMRRADVPALLLADPVLIRYATGVRSMQPWALHSTYRMALVPAEGKVIAYEYAGSEHLAAGLETVAEVRLAVAHFYAGTGDGQGGEDPRTRAWVEEIAGQVRRWTGERPRLAIDRHVDHFSARALERAGITLLPGAPLLARAQSVKSAEEIQCMTHAIAVAEVGMYRLRQALEPGRSEIDLWAILERTNVEFGGEYMDTRLLTSGGRTNPWYQEAGHRLVRPGDLVAFDTDMIGAFGYDADVSRTYFCPPGRPSADQRRLYRQAFDQLHHNLEQIRPGLTFAELSARAYRLPDDVLPCGMTMVWHGVGLYGQWPTIVDCHLAEQSDRGVLEPGMTLCCESYVGLPGGLEGVKLEQQVVVTDAGYQLLTTYPFEDDLLGREV